MEIDFSKVKVLVVGDVILDEYVYGKVERISPEAPVPILRKDNSEVRLGGAANVAANCVALGAETKLFSIIGKDEDAELLKELCKEKNIYNLFCENEEINTPRKTRFVSDGQQILRVDKESKGKFLKEIPKIKSFLCHLDEVDVVIVSDYNKGCVNAMLMDFLKENYKTIVVDPKPANLEFYSGVSLVTPNRKEAIEMIGESVEDLRDEHIESLAILLKSPVLVTLGEDGIKYCDYFLKSSFALDSTNENGPSKIKRFSAVAQEVFDVTGAGDTVLAVVGLGMATNMDINSICKLVNKAAAQVVVKFGTATVDLKGLKQIGCGSVR